MFGESDDNEDQEQTEVSKSNVLMKRSQIEMMMKVERFDPVSSKVLRVDKEQNNVIFVNNWGATDEPPSFSVKPQQELDEFSNDFPKTELIPNIKTDLKLQGLKTCQYKSNPGSKSKLGHGTDNSGYLSETHPMAEQKNHLAVAAKSPAAKPLQQTEPHK